MKKILVSIDFSSVTEEVLRIAAEQARFFDGEIVLLHVENPEPDFVGYKPGPQVLRDNVAHDIKKNHRELDAIEKKLLKDSVKVKAFILQGATAETILHKANDIEADLIIMGTHGHGALHHLLLGSVTEEVVRKATCPLLLVPGREK